MAIILASDENKQMKSNKSKVLHKVLGKSLVKCVYDSLKQADICDVVTVIRDNAEQIKEELGEVSVYVEQKEHNVSSYILLEAIEKLKEKKDKVLVIGGNMPLISSKTVKNIFASNVINENDVTVVTDNFVVFDSDILINILKENKEVAFTDIIEIMKNKDLKIEIYSDVDHNEIMEINDKFQLEKANQIARERVIEYHLQNGVTMIDKSSTYIDYGVELGIDTIIYPNCIIESGTVIGENCVIGPNSKITESRIGNGVSVMNSVLIQTSVGDDTTVGPFAYLRPNSNIGKKARIGDFVEIKNSNIGNGTKVSHLTYVGDSDVGEKVNFGCGTVTVNYDGKKKYRTTIEDNAFIGCNTNLVAPVTVKAGAYTAAGTTITKEVPSDALAIGRVRQENKEGWAGKKRKE